MTRISVMDAPCCDGCSHDRKQSMLRPRSDVWTALYCCHCCHYGEGKDDPVPASHVEKLLQHESDGKQLRESPDGSDRHVPLKPEPLPARNWRRKWR